MVHGLKLLAGDELRAGRIPVVHESVTYIQLHEGYALDLFSETGHTAS
jgi:hypothetical protein